MCEKFSQSHACDVLRKGEGGRGRILMTLGMDPRAEILTRICARQSLRRAGFVACRTESPLKGRESKEEGGRMP